VVANVASFAFTVTLPFELKSVSTISPSRGLAFVPLDVLLTPEPCAVAR
jgi:hypothetical protein